METIDFDKYEETPIRLKKKPSSTSKSVRKANHRHDYVEVLVYERETKVYHKGEICRICGKVNNIKFLDIRKDKNSNTFVVLHNDEIRELDKDLTVVEIDSVFNRRNVEVPCNLRIENTEND